jgi:hypothetical protein
MGKCGIIRLCDQKDSSPVEWYARACSGPSTPQLDSLRTCTLVLCIFVVLASAVSPIDDPFQAEYGNPSRTRVMAVKARYSEALRAPCSLMNAITGATQPALARSELSVPRDLWSNVSVEGFFGSNAIRPPPARPAKVDFLPPAH